jgi:hypothetical protein
VAVAASDDSEAMTDDARASALDAMPVTFVIPDVPVPNGRIVPLATMGLVERVEDAPIVVDAGPDDAPPTIEVRALAELAALLRSVLAPVRAVDAAETMELAALSRLVVVVVSCADA